jgi:3-isopropylmalate/(R)-2-methylmalate dehydratase large subunit
MRIVYQGQLRPWVGGKDLILHTIGRIGVSGALYKAIEFSGPAIDALPMSGRFTMSNMAVEAGAKAGLFAVDDVTRTYVQRHSPRLYRAYEADDQAACVQEVCIDASLIEPQVAFPHLPQNVRPVSEAGDVRIDQVVIGSCTNGRLDDLRVAAQLLRGRQVHADVRCQAALRRSSVRLKVARRRRRRPRMEMPAEEP